MNRLGFAVNKYGQLRLFPQLSSPLGWVCVSILDLGLLVLLPRPSLSARQTVPNLEDVSAVDVCGGDTWTNQDDGGAHQPSNHQMKPNQTMGLPPEGSV